MESKKDNEIKIKFKPVDKELEEAFVSKKQPAKLSRKESKEKPQSPNKEKTKFSKKFLILLIVGIVGLIGGLVCLLLSFLLPKTKSLSIEFPTIPSSIEEDTTYSSLTGEVLKDANLKNAPTFCIQIPNGTDGARPQAGLNTAGVIYEAIAEAGITRFDAVFQNPTAAVIGPIRSLRTYYLDFAAPFGCTVVHAGGPSDAISALRSGGYRDLDESLQYMFRSSVGGRRWNNLFTTAEDLKKFNEDHDYNSSDIKGFSRLTPKESDAARANALATHKLSITAPSDGDTSELTAKTSKISLSFKSSVSYNVNYVYDIKSNTYTRSYASGGNHEVYNCPNENLGSKSPESICNLTTMTPTVVIAMMVPEKRAADNYHEDITMIGTGDAYIFQNGTSIKASWSKSSRNDQIKFIDSENNEVKLAPGQTFISAVPNYGSVDY